MKKIIKLIPIITLLLLTMLIVLYKDIEEKSTYYAYRNRSYTGLTLNEDNDKVDRQFLDELETIATQHNVVLVKQTYDRTAQKKQIFYSKSNIKEVLDDKQLNYEIVNENMEDGFGATYDTKDVNQKFTIHDLMGNDDYELYPFSSMQALNIYRFGSYNVYYEEESDCNLFFLDLSQRLESPIEALQNNNTGVMMGHTDFIAIGMIGSVILSIILYISILLFKLYRESKTVGCLQLLGYDSKAIAFYMIKQEMKPILILSVVILFGAILFVKNISLQLFCLIALTHVFVMFGVMVLIYLSVVFIKRGTSISNIVKNESILGKVLYLYFFIKYIAILALIFFSLSLFPSLQELYVSSQNIRDNENVLDWYGSKPPVPLVG